MLFLRCLNMTAQRNKTEGPAVLPLRAAFPNVSNVTTWRWRKNGWLPTINISGRPYVTAEALAEFTRRAQAGEFAKTAVVPPPPKKGVTP